MKKNIINSRKFPSSLRTQFQANIQYHDISKDIILKQSNNNQFFRRKTLEQGTTKYVILINALYPKTYIKQHNNLKIEITTPSNKKLSADKRKFQSTYLKDNYYSIK